MEIICVCGSVRFKDEMLAFRDEQNAKGSWVLLPENMELDIQKIDMRVKEKMDSLHRAKIDCADSVLIWNKGGYIGESTKNEIDYALSVSKTVKFLEAMTPNVPKLSEARRANAKRLADELMYAFAWDATEEGYDFWKDIHGRLMRLKRKGF